MDVRFRRILIALRESEVFPKLREVAAAGKHLRPRVIGLRAPVFQILLTAHCQLRKFHAASDQAESCPRKRPI